MSAPQPNAWTPARSRQSASRTPQNRSGTASPAQSNNPSQGSRAEKPPQPDAWSRPQSQTREPSTTNGSAHTYTHINGFNAADVKIFLARDGQNVPAVYRSGEPARNSGNAWGSKPNTMANGQPFFTQLAKQIAALEGGG